MRTREVRCGDSLIEIELYKSGRSEKIYDVYLKAGNWPSECILIHVCEGGSVHRGGRVESGDSPFHVIVTVFI